jgi:hypothetical protein
MLPEFDGPNGHMFNFPDLVAARAAAKKARRTKKAAPSPNGDNGPPAAPEPEPPPKQPQPGRTTDGKFAAGNSGGPGNPFARQMASFRQALYEAVTRDMLKDLATRLWGMALGGNVAAAQLLFQYLVGKPQDPPDPDRLDHDEWQVYQSEMVGPDEMKRLLAAMPATMANHWADGIWPVLADCNIRRPMLEGLRADRLRREAAAAEQAEHPPQSAPTPNGVNGYSTPSRETAPSTPAEAVDAPAPVTAVPLEHMAAAATEHLPGRQQTAGSATTGHGGRPESRAEPPPRRATRAKGEPATGLVPPSGAAGAPSPYGDSGVPAVPPDGSRDRSQGRPRGGGRGAAPSPNGGDG